MGLMRIWTVVDTVHAGLAEYILETQGLVKHVIQLVFRLTAHVMNTSVMEP